MYLVALVELPDRHPFVEFCDGIRDLLCAWTR